MTKKLMERAGLDEGRLFLDWVSAAEGQRFADLVSGFVKKIKALGPLGKKEGLERDQMTCNLSAAIEAAATDRLRWLVGREYDLLTKDNTYGKTISQDFFDSVMDDAIRQEYVKASIAQVLKDGPMSVKDLAERIGTPPRRILINLMEMRMKGRLTSSGAEGRSPLYSLR